MKRNIFVNIKVIGILTLCLIVNQASALLGSGSHGSSFPSAMLEKTKSIILDEVE